MISTVTTSTITTAALGGSLALIVVVALLFFLIQKEILSAATDARAKALSRILTIVIVPLVLSFILIAFVKVSEVLGR